ncbi:hypothetical protein FNV58_01220 (plasmid) [Streptomyces sp. RLB1-9]|uniref:hypothetical protein n=1 Tax=Streptomyces sp. RLB1-9 TaxID=2594454 RepID=UPI0011621CD3|nr:hypothetical protein [Streptomyces sp. RLB1-9]QDN94982.1 hypothetical protein FNV58_01220 [Streptomyces sp. RLB1-9]
MAAKTITSKLTAAQRQALLHADPATGQINASGCNFREELRRKRYAESSHGTLYLTEYGWRLHALLKEEHKEFAVAGVPWTKMQEITDLYLLNGLSVEEISRRTRVTGGGVMAVLAFRQVLPDAA